MKPFTATGHSGEPAVLALSFFVKKQQHISQTRNYSLWKKSSKIFNLNIDAIVKN